ncbi:MAG: zinc-dependent peptidase [Pseudomonadales bacterium]|nr:zinc-dependent peptidase [Pseudomonadales bacterium]
MTPVFVFCTLILVVIAALWYALAWPAWRRRRIVARSFPPEWEALLDSRLPIFAAMRPDQQDELRDLIKVFIAGKTYIGCAGLDVTDEMRVVIAAQACLLLLGRPTHEYADLHYIYLFPSTFRATREVRNEIGLVSTESRDLLGESWDNGRVVLAWDDVEHGVRNWHDGENVVLHEFAHQLDSESGATNGVPLLYTKAAYKTWAYVFGREFEALARQDPHSPSLIDHYGATNPAEFFAVATETFFEEPERMYAHHRELFTELSTYYRLDPREWQRRNAPRETGTGKLSAP